MLFLIFVQNNYYFLNMFILSTKMRENKKNHICICASTNALSHAIHLCKDVYNTTISYIINNIIICEING